MTALFVTATGTDIGKTFVATNLIRHWRTAGRKVEALKPVASGFDPASAEASDPGMLLAALGRPITPNEIERVAHWRFAAPLSPDMAAEREGRTLDFDAVVEHSRAAIAQAKDVLLIEGIGGVMVPLDDTHTVVDWMMALDIPLLVVTGSYLGSLSHTLTCLDALARRNLVVKALVVNETPGATVGLDETARELERFAPLIPVVTLPRLSDNAAKHATMATLAAMF
jgi:dethiobiotin synthetase